MLPVEITVDRQTCGIDVIKVRRIDRDPLLKTDNLKISI